MYQVPPPAARPALPVRPPRPVAQPRPPLPTPSSAPSYNRHTAPQPPRVFEDDNEDKELSALLKKIDQHRVPKVEEDDSEDDDDLLCDILDKYRKAKGPVLQSVENLPSTSIKSEQVSCSLYYSALPSILNTHH